jgi:hypothetical protein
MMRRRRQHGQLASLQVSHRYPAAGVLTPEEGCSPHSGQHCISTGLGLAIEKDFEPGAEAVLTHLPQPSSASRYPEGETLPPEAVDKYNVLFTLGRQHEITDGSATINPLGQSHNHRDP